MRHSHFFKESRMMQIAIGFIIAALVGLTGIGGGSFTTPVLILLVGLPATEAVGTAMVFSAVVRLIAAPFYVLGRNVKVEYLSLLLVGAIPGLLVGIYILRRLGSRASNPVLLISLGTILVASSSITLMRRSRNRQAGRNNARWLPWLALPIGIETGFSSAGAGALGTVLLLNFSSMSAAQVVGTDLVFGIVLAVIAGAFHLSWGSISTSVLSHLLIGGVPGVLVGCFMARKVPARRFKAALAVVAILVGLQLVWTGARTAFAQEQPKLWVHPAAPRTAAAARAGD
jgi:uncharacterized membrane protein YfcA